jgi:hypothetical protein
VYFYTFLLQSSFLKNKSNGWIWLVLSALAPNKSPTPTASYPTCSKIPLARSFQEWIYYTQSSMLQQGCFDQCIYTRRMPARCCERSKCSCINIGLNNQNVSKLSTLTCQQESSMALIGLTRKFRNHFLQYSKTLTLEHNWQESSETISCNIQKPLTCP